MFNIRTGRSQTGVPGLDSHESLTLGSLEWLPVGMLLVRSDGTVVFANRKVEELFGHTRADLVGQPVELLLPAWFEPSSSSHPEADPGTVRALYGRHRSGSQLALEVESRSMEMSSGRVVLVSVTLARGHDGETPESARERTAFGHLIADLSMEFINLPVARVEAAIKDAVRRIGEGLDLDRCTLYRIQPDGTLTDAVGWAREGIPLLSVPVNAEEAFPWAVQTLRAGQLLSFSSVDEIPSVTDREGYRSVGTRSAVTVPLAVDGRVVGAIGFNMLRAERQWDSEMLNRFTVIAAIFNGVLARQKNDEAARRRVRRDQASAGPARGREPVPAARDPAPLR